MENQFDIFYFSGTHWDREWYQSFQGFRYRLVKMFDGLIDVLESDPAFGVFHLDGQTIVLDDYMEIVPKNRQKLEKLIQDGRLMVGPWYVMPDEFLLSGESLIRNLMIGHRKAKQWGAEAWKYGYVCDIFGHIAQMPQIFNGFSIKYALLGRGTTDRDPEYFKWRSPDGSECITYKLSEHYGYGAFKHQVYENAGSFQENEALLTERIKSYIEQERVRSEIPVVIVMDGDDHAEVPADTTAYIEKIKELYPEAAVHHTNLCEQGKLLERWRDRLPVKSGELNATAEQWHPYLHLITDTLSSYYPLKQANDICQGLLEKQIEPLLVLSAFDGMALKREFVDLAYRYLIQNHPHDSICGCSIDSVHRDMEYRFSQVKELCAALVTDYVYHMGKAYGEEGGGACEGILTVYNPLPFAMDKTVSAEIDFKTDYPARYQEPFGYEEINSFRIYDYEGNEIPYQVTEIKRGYLRRYFNNLCDNRDVHTVTLRVKAPACGRAEYRIVLSETPVRYKNVMKSGDTYAENEFIRVSILGNGALAIYDKKTKKTYTQLGNIADDGEIGDGWYHAEPVADRRICSNGGGCTIEKMECGPSRCVFRIIRNLEVPEEIIEDKHGKRRSKNTVTLRFVTDVCLSAESRSVDVKLRFENTAKDHRLKLLIPTGICGNYFAGQAFYCCERKSGIDISTQDWCEMDRCEKAMNGIVGKRDTDGAGIAFVSAEGLHECAAYDDENGTLGITLLRGFRTTVLTNGETNCQLNRELEYRFSLVLLDEDVTYADLLKVQDAMACAPICRTAFVKDEARIAAPIGRMSVEGENVAVSIIKRAEEGDMDDIVIRVFNTADRETCGAVKISCPILAAAAVNLNEEYIAPIDFDGSEVSFSLKPWEIKSIKLKIDMEMK